MFPICSSQSARCVITVSVLDAHNSRPEDLELGPHDLMDEGMAVGYFQKESVG